MKPIAIITLVAAVAVAYMMFSLETSALENLFRSIMIEYKKSYNSKAEYKFRMEVLRMNLESQNIPWRIPNSVPVFRLELTKFSELMYSNENCSFKLCSRILLSCRSNYRDSIWKTLVLNQRGHFYFYYKNY